MTLVREAWNRTSEIQLAPATGGQELMFEKASQYSHSTVVLRMLTLKSCG